MNNSPTPTEKLVETVELKPGDQPNVSLGEFNKVHPPKGFSIHLTPDPQTDAIATNVAKIKRGDSKYELILQIANYGSQTIHAEVWRM